MDALGFKVSLWQYPHIRPEIDQAEEALREGYVGKETQASKRHWLGYTLDFTNPTAVNWYQSLLKPVLEAGASAIKADFGEEIDEGAVYQGIEGQNYHNLFALLYQKAVWEATETVRGAGDTLIWARSCWTGSQRYPIHWGGDAACTYDGLAGTICGGLHITACLRWKVEYLPLFVQWKMPGAIEYVLGIKPANCHMDGRPVKRQRGTLVTLQPGEQRLFDLEFEALLEEEE